MSNKKICKICGENKAEADSMLCDKCDENESENFAFQTYAHGYEQGKEEGRKEMLNEFKLTDKMKHKIAEQVKFMQERAEKTGDRDIWDMLELFTIIENAIKSAR